MKNLFKFKFHYLIELFIVVAGFIVVLAYQKDNPPPEMTASPESTPVVSQTLDEALPSGSSVDKRAEAMICLDVDDGKPLLVKSSFSALVDYLYCYVQVQPPPGVVRHRWMYDGEEMSEELFTVRDKNQTTWSRMDMSPQWEGEWWVEIRNERDELLTSVSFTLR
jgi:hypothetical protein